MENLLDWNRFIFALPLAAGLLLSAGLVLNGLGHSNAHHRNHSANPGHRHGWLPQLFGCFGFGKGASLAVLLSVLLASWGLVGLLATVALAPFFSVTLVFGLAAALGLLGAAIGGNTMGTVVQRLLGQLERQQNLVGQGGRAVFRIDHQQGVANIRDRFGNIHRVECKTYPGELPLQGGQELVVVDFDAAQGVYFVQAQPPPE